MAIFTTMPNALPAMNPSEPSRWIQLLLVPVLFYAGVKLSLAFAVLPEVVVMLWIPNSVLLATLFHYGFRRFGYFAVLIVAAEIAADYPTFSPLEATLFGTINLIEVTIAYGLLRRWRFDPRFPAPVDIAKFVMAGPVAGAFAAACSAAAVYSSFRGTEGSYFESLRVWWLSDGIGLLILTPLALSLWPPGGRVIVQRPPLRWYDAVALIGALVVIVAFLNAERGILHGVRIRPVLLLPLAVYTAARFGVRTTSIASAAVAGTVLFATKNGLQPYGELSISETADLAQQFIIVLSVTSLGLAALLTQLRAATRELEDRVRDRTAQLSAANTLLQQLAVTDALTGLPNRRALFDLLQREIIRERRRGHPLAVVMFDIDNFKEVNDRYGHAAGDTVLRHVARVTANEVRGMDTLARYGGDEFVLVLPESDEAQALQLAERILAALRSSEVRIDRHALRITASFGVASLGADDLEPEQLLRRVDAALYAAKANGRNQVAAASP
jgi:diguanylate cyclase (GGDEF)-like protein